MNVSDSAPPDPRIAHWLASRARRWSSQLALGTAVVVLCVVLTVESPFFLHTDNILNITQAMSYTGIIAAIETIVLLSGGLDLSIGAVMALSGCICAAVLQSGYGWEWALLASLGLSALIGAVNGGLISGIGIDPLIATIGTQFAIRGLASLVGSEQLITDTNILYLGQGRILGIPVAALLMLLTFLLAIWWLNYTVFGRHLKAIGGTPNGHAARLAGIPVRRRRMQTYILSGLFSGFAGIVLAGYSGAGLAYAAVGIELTVIAGVVLGGTSIFGGQGTIVGTLIGVLFFAIIANGLVLLNVPTLWQQIVQGTVLILAVGIDKMRTRRVVIA